MVLTLFAALHLVYSLAVIRYAAHDPLVDTYYAQNTIFQTEAKSVVYNTPLISRNTKKPEVVILGASNSSLALRPADLIPLLGKTPVHNLAIGGQNMRSVSQLVDLIYRQTPRQQRHNIVFVIGSWVGLTVDDQRRWPSKLTDVDQELLRYGLFQKGNNELVHSWLPDSYLSNAFEAVWPFMLPYALYAEMGRDLLSREKITFIPPGVILPWHQPEKMLNEATRTDSQIAADLKSYVGYVGPASEWTGGGFADLQKTAAQISREDGHLIFIDLPIPSQSRSLEICTIYEQKIKSTLASFQSDPHIEYVDMQEACNDDEFFDSVHARPKVTMKIAQKAALPINRALNKLLAQKDGE